MPSLGTRKNSLISSYYRQFYVVAKRLLGSVVAAAWRGKKSPSTTAKPLNFTNINHPNNQKR
jgi:hypothetical protein